MTWKGWLILGGASAMLLMLLVVAYLLTQGKEPCGEAEHLPCTLACPSGAAQQELQEPLTEAAWCERPDGRKHGPYYSWFRAESGGAWSASGICVYEEGERVETAQAGIGCGSD